MAKTYDTTADWREVPAEMLSGEAAHAYERYKVAQRLAAQAREAFETKFSALIPLPSGKRYGFGYRFGKLSVAVLDGAPAKPKPAAAPAPRSLADLLGIRAI
jgi:hypothetical protein